MSDTENTFRWFEKSFLLNLEIIPSCHLIKIIGVMRKNYEIKKVGWRIAFSFMDTVNKNYI